MREDHIWTQTDEYDSMPVSLASGEETTIRGSSYRPYFEGYPDSDETQYAIASRPVSSEDANVYATVWISCPSCEDDGGDSDCEFFARVKWRPDLTCTKTAQFRKSIFDY